MTLTTKDIEKVLYNHLWKLGTYLCFEVAMPRVKERVDLLQYDTKGIWRFYELKISKSDFYSKCKHTFLGHYNYYVLPPDLYEKVKDDIPKNIGIYIVTERKCYCKKKAIYQKLQVDKDKLMFNFMQALSREYSKRWR